MKNLTLIIPAKNEPESLPIFLNEIKNFECKKLIVLKEDDVLTMNSLDGFNDISILNQKKSGYGNAIIEGINFCETDYFCIINADGSMDPKYLSEMYNLCQNIDLVFTSRYLKNGGGSDDDTIITFVGNKIFSFLGNLFFNLKISDILFTYVLGKTSSFKFLNLQSQDFRLCVELPIKAKKKGLKFIDIPSYERSRIGGVKKVNAIKDGFLIMTKIIVLFLLK
jgi:glycosyltransferase involved in cell wall biosynthesis